MLMLLLSNKYLDKLGRFYIPNTGVLWSQLFSYRFRYNVCVNNALVQIIHTVSGVHFTSKIQFKGQLDYLSLP